MKHLSKLVRAWPLALIPAAPLVLGGTGCGPMPGYKPPSSSSGDTAPERTTSRRMTDPERQMVKIRTDRKNVYYIVDRERRLCFFHNGGAMATVDCASIPEARDLLGEEPAGEEPAPAAPPEEAPAAQPLDSDDPPEATGLGATPSADEKRRFTLAYISIYCANASGDTTSPEEVIRTNGLTADRYSQIEGWMAGDKRVWRALTNAARNACPSSGEAPTPPRRRGDAVPTHA